MKNKTEVENIIIDFFSLLETQFISKINYVWTNNRKEYSMPKFYDSIGIIHQLSCPYMP